MKKWLYRYNPLLMFILGALLLTDALINNNVVNMISPIILMILAIYIVIIRKIRNK
ncbi:SoxR reducing system RseC family protein [Leuconostoc miyukkimchii]|uniref:SoxR reducing system RseC family protein n=1 Tax=Leuconostoc miyukkimchii TaxID=910540 RepID=UPI001C7DC334|nr:SoxR reducing system RseC family protein [Leuconostoc miyukkimchii]